MFLSPSPSSSGTFDSSSSSSFEESSSTSTSDEADNAPQEQFEPLTDDEDEKIRLPDEPPCEPVYECPFSYTERTDQLRWVLRLIRAGVVLCSSDVYIARNFVVGRIFDAPYENCGFTRYYVYDDVPPAEVFILVGNAEQSLSIDLWEIRMKRPETKRVHLAETKNISNEFAKEIVSVPGERMKTRSSKNRAPSDCSAVVVSLRFTTLFTNNLPTERRALEKMLRGMVASTLPNQILELPIAGHLNFLAFNNFLTVEERVEALIHYVFLIYEHIRKRTFPVDSSGQQILFSKALVVDDRDLPKVRDAVKTGTGSAHLRKIFLANDVSDAASEEAPIDVEDYFERLNLSEMPSTSTGRQDPYRRLGPIDINPHPAQRYYHRPFPLFARIAPLATVLELDGNLGDTEEDDADAPSTSKKVHKTKQPKQAHSWKATHTSSSGRYLDPILNYKGPSPRKNVVSNQQQTLLIKHEKQPDKRIDDSRARRRMKTRRQSSTERMWSKKLPVRKISQSFEFEYEEKEQVECVGVFWMSRIESVEYTVPEVEETDEVVSKFHRFTIVAEAGADDDIIPIEGCQVAKSDPNTEISVTASVRTCPPSISRLVEQEYSDENSSTEERCLISTTHGYVVESDDDYFEDECYESYEVQTGSSGIEPAPAKWTIKIGNGHDESLSTASSSSESLHDITAGTFEEQSTSIPDVTALESSLRAQLRRKSSSEGSLASEVKSSFLEAMAKSVRVLMPPFPAPNFVPDEEDDQEFDHSSEDSPPRDVVETILFCSFHNESSNDATDVVRAESSTYILETNVFVPIEEVVVPPVTELVTAPKTRGRKRKSSLKEPAEATTSEATIEQKIEAPTAKRQRKSVAAPESAEPARRRSQRLQLHEPEPESTTVTVRGRRGPKSTKTVPAVEPEQELPVKPTETENIEVETVETEPNLKRRRGRPKKVSDTESRQLQTVNRATSLSQLDMSDTIVDPWLSDATIFRQSEQDDSFIDVVNVSGDNDNAFDDEPTTSAMADDTFLVDVTGFEPMVSPESSLCSPRLRIVEEEEDSASKKPIQKPKERDELLEPQDLQEPKESQETEEPLKPQELEEPEESNTRNDDLSQEDQLLDQVVASMLGPLVNNLFETDSIPDSIMDPDTIPGNEIEIDSEMLDDLLETFPWLEDSEEPMNVLMRAQELPEEPLIRPEPAMKPPVSLPPRTRRISARSLAQAEKSSATADKPASKPAKATDKPEKIPAKVERPASKTENTDKIEKIPTTSNRPTTRSSRSPMKSDKPPEKTPDKAEKTAAATENTTNEIEKIPAKPNRPTTRSSKSPVKSDKPPERAPAKSEKAVATTETTDKIEKTSAIANRPTTRSSRSPVKSEKPPSIALPKSPPKLEKPKASAVKTPGKTDKAPPKTSTPQIEKGAEKPSEEAITATPMATRARMKKQLFKEEPETLPSTSAEVFVCPLPRPKTPEVIDVEEDWAMRENKDNLSHVTSNQTESKMWLQNLDVEVDDDPVSEEHKKLLGESGAELFSTDQHRFSELLVRIVSPEAASSTDRQGPFDPIASLHRWSQLADTSFFQLFKTDLGLRNLEGLSLDDTRPGNELKFAIAFCEVSNKLTDFSPTVNEKLHSNLIAPPQIRTIVQLINEWSTAMVEVFKEASDAAVIVETVRARAMHLFVYSALEMIRLTQVAVVQFSKLFRATLCYSIIQRRASILIGGWKSFLRRGGLVCVVREVAMQQCKFELNEIAGNAATQLGRFLDRAARVLTVSADSQEAKAASGHFDRNVINFYRSLEQEDNSRLTPLRKKPCTYCSKVLDKKFERAVHERKEHNIATDFTQHSTPLAADLHDLSINPQKFLHILPK